MRIMRSTTLAIVTAFAVTASYVPGAVGGGEAQFTARILPVAPVVGNVGAADASPDSFVAGSQYMLYYRYRWGQVELFDPFTGTTVATDVGQYCEPPTSSGHWVLDADPLPDVYYLDGGHGRVDASEPVTFGPVLQIIDRNVSGSWDMSMARQYEPRRWWNWGSFRGMYIRTERVTPPELSMRCSIPLSKFQGSGWEGRKRLALRMESSWENGMSWGGNVVNVGNVMRATVSYQSPFTLYSLVFDVKTATGIEGGDMVSKCDGNVGGVAVCDLVSFTTVGGGSAVKIQRTPGPGLIAIDGKTVPNGGEWVSIPPTSSSGIGLLRKSTYVLPITVRMDTAGEYSHLLIVRMEYD